MRIGYVEDFIWRWPRLRKIINPDKACVIEMQYVKKLRNIYFSFKKISMHGLLKHFVGFWAIVEKFHIEIASANYINTSLSVNNDFHSYWIN